MSRASRPGSSCRSCAAIPDSVSIRTDCDESFPSEALRLERTTGCGSEAFWRCAACGSLYYWMARPTYPGGHDEQELERLTPLGQVWFAPVFGERGQALDVSALVASVLASTPPSADQWPWRARTARDRLFTALRHLMAISVDITPAVPLLLADMAGTGASLWLALLSAHAEQRADVAGLIDTQAEAMPDGLPGSHLLAALRQRCRPAPQRTAGKGTRPWKT